MQRLGARTRRSMAVALLLMAFWAERWPTDAQQPLALASLDYFQIHELNARYSHGLDRGDGDLFASVFTADGVLIDERGRTTSGATALAALAAGAPGKGPTNVRHLYTNLAIDAAPTGAWAKSMAMIIDPEIGGGRGIDRPRQATEGWITGQYWDQLVKTADGWRIKERRFLPVGIARPETQPMSTTMPRFIAGSAPGGPNSLTAADYAEIHQLYARYAWAYDKGGLLDNGGGFADLFTNDGTFLDADGTTATGRTNLMAMIMRRGDPHRVRTAIANIMIEPTAAGVSTRAYIVRRRYPRLPDPSYQEPAGMSFARLARTPEGWRFEAMRIVAPGSPLPANVTTIAATAARPPSLRARQSGVTFTPADTADIMHLYARYSHGFESKAYRGALYGSVFTDDAEYRDEESSNLSGPLAGLQTMIQRYGALPDGATLPITDGHQTWNILIDRAPWGAVGRAYMGNGYYTDVLVDTTQGWRVKSRSYRRDNAMPAPVTPAPVNR